MAAILCSFVYLVAQIYGVGLITTQLAGVDFVLGIFLGLGGVLVCSFLGGMRAVTWTQVAQYIILVIAYLVPVVWLSIKQTGVPVPQLAVGQQLAKVGERERQLLADPKEREVRALFQARADAYAEKLRDVPGALVADRAEAQRRSRDLKAANAPLREIQLADRALATLPKNEDAARETWTRARAVDENRALPLAGMAPHAQQFSGRPDGDAHERQLYDESRRNFLALVFCLMIGTAALPHILMRSYTTPTVRSARRSVAWSLFFISLLYLTAPALAVLVKFEVFEHLVGLPFDRLPGWIASWTRIDPNLVSVVDINHDGILQLGEIRIGGDLIVLATPEIAGLPYVVTGMVAAGGLAAALSTADGPAADHRQCALARPVLQGHGAAGLGCAAGDGVQGAPAGRGARCGGGGGTAPGRHPVPGDRGLLDRGFGVLPGAGAGNLLVARQPMGSGGRDAGRSRAELVLPGAQRTGPARAVRHRGAGGAVVGDPAGVGRGVRGPARIPGLRGREPAGPGADACRTAVRRQLAARRRDHRDRNWRNRQCRAIIFGSPCHTRV